MAKMTNELVIDHLESAADCLRDAYESIKKIRYHNKICNHQLDDLMAKIIVYRDKALSYKSQFKTASAPAQQNSHNDIGE